MANSWLTFLKQFRKKNPKLSLKDAMKQGSSAYKKSKGGVKKKAPKKKVKAK